MTWHREENTSDFDRMSRTQDEKDNINVVEQCFNARFELWDAVKERFYGDGNAAGKIVDLIEKTFLKE